MDLKGTLVTSAILMGAPNQVILTLTLNLTLALIRTHGRTRPTRLPGH